MSTALGHEHGLVQVEQALTDILTLTEGLEEFDLLHRRDESSSRTL